MKQQLNEHQARIQALARHVWSSEEDAQKFLTMPHQLLGGETAIEIAATEDGAKQVEMVLQNIFWGLPH